MTLFRIQYASNLFVDLHTKSFPHLLKPVAPTLALLGNIGRPDHHATYHFLNYCSKGWDSVLWIPGPHELSNPKGGRATYQEKTSTASTLAKEFKNVRLMDSKEAVFHNQNFVLLGAPLWTHTFLQTKGQPEFTSIFTSTDEAGPLPLTNSIRNELYRDDFLYLKERSLFWQIVHPTVSLVYLTHTIPHSCLLRDTLHESTWSRMPMDVLSTPRYFTEPLASWLGGASGSTNQTFLDSNHSLCGVNGLYEYPSLETNTLYSPTAFVELGSTQPVRPIKPYSLPPILSSLLKPNARLFCQSHI